jgi:hypothetical protein
LNGKPADFVASMGTPQAAPCNHLTYIDPPVLAWVNLRPVTNSFRLSPLLKSFLVNGPNSLSSSSLKKKNHITVSPCRFPERIFSRALHIVAQSFLETVPNTK